jgi:hypothetical protein
LCKVSIKVYPNVGNFAKCCWKNQRKIHCAIFWVLWHLHNEFWFMDVKKRGWQICFDCSFFEPQLGALSCNHWFVWDNNIRHIWGYHGLTNELGIAIHRLNAKIFAYVKDEGNDFWTMTIVLTFVVFCKVLGLVEPLTWSCWGHVMSKCCQYATYNSKVFVGLMSISIKECQSIL